MSHHWRHYLLWVLAAAMSGTVWTSGCSNLVRRSVRDGVFGYISGNVGNSLGTGQLNNFLSDILNGGVFGDGSTTDQ